MSTVKSHLTRSGAGAGAGAVLLGVYEVLADVFPGASHGVLILAAAVLIALASSLLGSATRALGPRAIRILMRQLTKPGTGEVTVPISELDKLGAMAPGPPPQEVAARTAGYPGAPYAAPPPERGQVGHDDSGLPNPPGPPPPNRGAGI